MFVIEPVEGESLEQFIAKKGDLLDKERANDILVDLIDVVENLQTKYGEPIIHRDIDPRNILIDNTGRIRLMDFWASVRREYIPEAYGGAETNDFRSPEIENGVEGDGGSRGGEGGNEGKGSIGLVSSDLYSIAAIYLWLRTGKTAYEVKNEKIPFKMPQSLEPGTRKFLAKCLAKDPKERFASAKEMGDAFQKKVAEPNVALKALGGVLVRLERLVQARKEAMQGFLVSLCNRALAHAREILEQIKEFTKIVIRPVAGISQEQARGVVEQRTWLFALLGERRQQEILARAGYLHNEKAAIARKIVLSGHLPKGVVSTIGSWVAQENAKALFTIIEPVEPAGARKAISSVLKKLGNPWGFGKEEKTNILRSMIARALPSGDSAEFVLKGWETYASNVIDSLLDSTRKGEDAEKLFLSGVLLRPGYARDPKVRLAGRLETEKQRASVLIRGRYRRDEEDENATFQLNLLKGITSIDLKKEIALSENEVHEKVEEAIARDIPAASAADMLLASVVDEDGSIRNKQIKSREAREVYAAKVPTTQAAQVLSADVVKSRYGEVILALKVLNRAEASGAFSIVSVRGFNGGHRNRSAEAILKYREKEEFGSLAENDLRADIIEGMIRNTQGNEQERKIVAEAIGNGKIFYLVPILIKLYLDKSPQVSEAAAESIIQLAEFMFEKIPIRDPKGADMKTSGELDSDVYEFVRRYGNDYPAENKTGKKNLMRQLANVVMHGEARI